MSGPKKAGRSTTPSPFLSSIEYDVSGEVLAYDASYLSFVADFDLAGRAMVRAHQSTSGNDFVLSALQRDGSGNLQHVVESGTPRGLVAQYDAQGRLSSVDGTMMRGYQDCVYEYDTAGNRTVETCGSTAITYEYEPGTSKHVGLSFDANAAVCGPGARISRPIMRYLLGRASNGYTRKYPRAEDEYTLSYGPGESVYSATTPSGVYAYEYDHRELRWRAAGPGGERTYVYGNDGALLMASHESKGYTEYVWLGGRAIAVAYASGPSDAPALHLTGTDFVGAPVRAWSATTGEFSWAADLDPFGAATIYLPGSSSPPQIQIDLRYPGQVEDPETGLYYNWWRYYDPNTGRYTTPDPIQVESEMVTLQADGFMMPNDYAYADSSPLVVTDFDGRNPRVAILIAAALARAAKLAKKLWDKCKKIRCKAEIHGPHHFFQSLGRRECHVQAWCWIKGQRKSNTEPIRIPIPCDWIGKEPPQ